MDSNEVRANLDEVLALVNDQLHHLRMLQERHSALLARASVVSDMIESTVDASDREDTVRLHEPRPADGDTTELADFDTDAPREALNEKTDASRALANRRRNSAGGLPMELSGLSSGGYR